jgi:23S rRNA (guanosine2251-2'-O)-methyltransferase
MRKLSVDEMDRMSVDAFKESEKFPFVIVLDNIRSLNNIGSFFRTADALRAEKILLCGYTQAPPHREITRSALGAEMSVAWEKCPNAAEAVKMLKSRGLQGLVRGAGRRKCAAAKLRAGPGNTLCICVWE